MAHKRVPAEIKHAWGATRGHRAGLPHMKTSGRSVDLVRGLRVARMGSEIKQAQSRAGGPLVDGASQNTIVVVGNAMVRKDHTALVDGARFVYRFNHLDNYGLNTGTRI